MKTDEPMMGCGLSVKNHAQLCLTFAALWSAFALPWWIAELADAEAPIRVITGFFGIPMTGGVFIALFMSAIDGVIILMNRKPKPKLKRPYGPRAILPWYGPHQDLETEDLEPTLK